jgi:hypothetical protein
MLLLHNYNIEPIPNIVRKHNFRSKCCEKYRASKSCDDDHVIKLYLRNLRSALRAF